MLWQCSKTSRVVCLCKPQREVGSDPRGYRIIIDDVPALFLGSRLSKCPCRSVSILQSLQCIGCVSLGYHKSPLVHNLRFRKPCPVFSSKAIPEPCLQYNSFLMTDSSDGRRIMNHCKEVLRIRHNDNLLFLRP